MYRKPLRVFGVIGTLVFLGVFIRTPSFPTPDKIFVLLVLGGLASGQAVEVLKRFTPFVVLLLVYESFRGLASTLNTHVNYEFMIVADKLLFFGHLPTKLLQDVLWHGYVQWYDFVFYGAYTLHFVLPFALAVVVWKLREKHYWSYVIAFLLVSFAGFLTFLAFPAAPPWLAVEKGYIDSITRVSSSVWAAFGVHDFPSVYNKIAPNQVAAVPSLHAAYSMLIALYTTKLFKTAWRLVVWVYPALIWVGTTYMGEHYVIDIIIGVLYAYVGYRVAPTVAKYFSKIFAKFWRIYKTMLK